MRELDAGLPPSARANLLVERWTPRASASSHRTVPRRQEGAAARRQTRQGKVPEEYLSCAGAKSPESLARVPPAEHERRRVVNDEQVPIGGALTRGRNMRHQDPLGCNSVVAEESVHTLKLAVAAHQPGEAVAGRMQRPNLQSASADA